MFLLAPSGPYEGRKAMLFSVSETKLPQERRECTVRKGGFAHLYNTMSHLMKLIGRRFRKGKEDMLLHVVIQRLLVEFTLTRETSLDRSITSGCSKEPLCPEAVLQGTNNGERLQPSCSALKCL